MINNKQSPSGSRNVSVEVLRMLLMLAIVFIHVPNLGGGIQKGLQHIACSALVCFVVISGCYGIRFSLSKMLRISVLGVFCSFIASILHIVVNGCKGLGDFIILWTNDCSGYWFLWAYVILMIISPFINSAKFPAAERHIFSYLVKLIDAGGGVLFVVFVWGFIATMQSRHRYIPLPAGLAVMSPLTLIGIYVAARVFVMSGVEHALRARWLVLLIALSSVMCYGKWLFRYNCVVPLILAMSVFVLFKNHVHLQDKLSIIKYVGPSLFPYIYGIVPLLANSLLHILREA